MIDEREVAEKCLTLLQEIYDRGNKPLHETDFKLYTQFSKASHYQLGRQAGLELAIMAIESEFKIKAKSHV
jgi:hypothetical protein